MSEELREMSEGLREMSEKLREMYEVLREMSEGLREMSEGLREMSEGLLSAEYLEAGVGIAGELSPILLLNWCEILQFQLLDNFITIRVCTYNFVLV